MIHLPGQQGETGAGGHSREPRDVRPRLLRVDKVPRKRAEAAPVVDARRQQRRPAGLQAAAGVGAPLDRRQVGRRLHGGSHSSGQEQVVEFS